MAVSELADGPGDPLLLEGEMGFQRRNWRQAGKGGMIG